jgi:hypothetical protein
LTYPEVGSLGPWTGLRTVSPQAHERTPANGSPREVKPHEVTLQMDGLLESEVDVREALGSWGGIPHASRNADWCVTDQLLRAAPILNPGSAGGYLLNSFRT